MCLNSLGTALSRTDPEQAWECYREGLQIARRVGNVRLRSTQLAGMASLHGRRGEIDESERLLQEALQIDREIGDLNGIAMQLGNLGDLYHRLNRLDEAESCMVEALELARTVGSPRMEGFWLTNLAIIRLDQDAIDVAALQLDDAKQIAERLQNRQLLGAIQAGQAVILRRRGREEEARQLWESGARALEETGANQDLEAMIKRWETAAGQ
jgi:tetratricopeptide (TPR) repeat protein